MEKSSLPREPAEHQCQLQSGVKDAEKSGESKSCASSLQAARGGRAPGLGGWAVELYPLLYFATDFFHLSSLLDKLTIRTRCCTTFAGPGGLSGVLSSEMLG